MKPLQVSAIRGPLKTLLRWYLLMFVVVTWLNFGKRAAKHSHCQQAAARFVGASTRGDDSQ